MPGHKGLNTADTANSQTLTLTDLPDDLIRPNNGGPESSIGNYLNVQALCRLSCVCKSLRGALKEDIETIKLPSLLTHIVTADLAAAEAIIKNDPSLLLKEGQVDDRGHLYKGTALTIALELGDISIYPKEHEEMVDMICRHLKTLPNGGAEIAKQIQTYFPNGFVEVKPYDFSEICTAIQNSSPGDAQKALNNDPNNPPSTYLYEALNKFREDIPRCPRNLCHFIAALAAYDAKFNKFNWGEKRYLFCIQVMGFIQRYLPLCDIYTLKQGIYDLVENARPLKRNGFEFEDWLTPPSSNGHHKIQVFPLDAGLGLGFNFVCGGLCGGKGVGNESTCCCEMTGSWGTVGWAGERWRTYVKQKQGALRTLYECFGSHIQLTRNLESAASCQSYFVHVPRMKYSG